MANPRKFSEKIALHNQKQAEETAAFEAILREVSATTRAKPQPPQPPTHHMHLQQPLGNFRGGSLPNVNQITNNSIDLQSALSSLEDMKQSTGRESLVDRCYRGERGRQVQQHRRGQFPFDKRIDSSPYGSPYLSPPPETSWRRTNSDSALHTSAMAPNHQQQHQRSITPQGRVELQQGDGHLKVENNQMWDPKNPNSQSRPKSCEVPGINIYPSPDQEMGGVHIPISNNTGSLPDLSNLHFPPPLTTPLDAEEAAGSYPAGSPGNLSPTSMHHMGGVLPGQQTSPGSRRRHAHGAPSPLVLQGSPTQMRHNLQGNALDVCVNSVHQTYHPYHIQQTSPQMQRLRPASASPVSTCRSAVNHTGATSPGRANSLSPNHNQTHLNVNSHVRTSQGTLTQYRNDQTSECPQSPTSPHSQPSYSPSQSPGLPPTTLSSSPFSEAYYQQQQAQTNALQHQFEQFNMLQETTAVTTNGVVSMYNVQAVAGGVHLTQASGADVSGVIGTEFNHNPYYSQSPQQPSSPQQHSPQASPSPSSVSAPSAIPPSPTQPTDLSFNPGQANKIPDIILTGADDLRQDFAKDISSAMAGMPDSFDSDLFLSDEALKDGLDPLDLQMLTDPNIVTDPATEDSFRMDRL